MVSIHPDQSGSIQPDYSQGSATPQQLIIQLQSLSNSTQSPQDIYQSAKTILANFATALGFANTHNSDPKSLVMVQMINCLNVTSWSLDDKSGGTAVTTAMKTMLGDVFPKLMTEVMTGTQVPPVPAYSSSTFPNLQKEVENFQNQSFQTPNQMKGPAINLLEDVVLQFPFYYDAMGGNTLQNPLKNLLIAVGCGVQTEQTGGDPSDPFSKYGQGSVAIQTFVSFVNQTPPTTFPPQEEYPPPFSSNGY